LLVFGRFERGLFLILDQELADQLSPAGVTHDLFSAICIPLDITGRGLTAAEHALIGGGEPQCRDP
jgi:hypothetical protein